MTPEERQLMYGIGYRDAIAGILAEYKDKLKLPGLAAFYKQRYE